MRFITILGLLATLVNCNDTHRYNVSPQQCEIEVRFSPRGGIAQAMVDDIKNAKSEIRVQVVAFTSVPIAAALISAQRDGKSVEAVLDPENLGNKNSVIHALYDAKIPVYIDKQHSIAHNKIIIIDQKIVYTGSYNLSKAAEESNSENSVKIFNCSVSPFIENYNIHKEHSYLYVPK